MCTQNILLHIASCGSGWPGVDAELPAVVSGAGCARQPFHFVYFFVIQPLPVINIYLCLVFSFKRDFYEAVALYQGCLFNRHIYRSTQPLSQGYFQTVYPGVNYNPRNVALGIYIVQRRIPTFSLIILLVRCERGLSVRRTFSYKI